MEQGTNIRFLNQHALTKYDNLVGDFKLQDALLTPLVSDLHVKGSAVR